jgi:hypothetical protein
MVDGNFRRMNEVEPKRNRAIIIRCSDRKYMQLLELIRSDSELYLIYSRSSGLKLVVTEEGF